MSVFARMREGPPPRQRVVWAGGPASPGWATASKNGADLWSPPLVHHQFYGEVTARSIPRKPL